MYIYFTPTTLFICTFIFRQTTTPSCVSCVCGLHYRKLLESSEDVKKKVIENFNEITFEADHYYELFRDGTVKDITEEIPFDVPEGWEWCRFKNVIDLYSGQDLVPERYNSEKKGIPYITGASNLDNGQVIINRWTDSPTTHATVNDLLLTCKGSGVGKMAVCNIKDAHIARQIMALRCTLAINLSYLQAAISSVVDEIKRLANGIIPGITREVVLNTLIPLPPYNEQLKIGQQINIVRENIDIVENEKIELNDIISTTKSKILDLAIRGKLVPQDPNDEPASVLLDRIRAEKEELIKQGKLKRDKKESIIYKGDDNCYYEEFSDGSSVYIDQEIPFNIPDSWCWGRLSALTVKEIKRGKAPKYVDQSNVLVFAQKCNLKKGGIDYTLAQYLDEKNLSKYNESEYLQAKDTVINSTGTGTLGRVGYIDSLSELPIVPDSHVTTIRTSNEMDSFYVFSLLKSMQPLLEKSGEGSTNQKELKPNTLQDVFVPIPPRKEQQRISNCIKDSYNILKKIEDSIT